jgi:hypothetical protein
MKCSATAASWFASFLLNALGQSRKPSHGHTHREVVSFGVARADVLRVGIAGDRGLTVPVQWPGLYFRCAEFGGPSETEPYSFTSIAKSILLPNDSSTASR